MSCINYYNMDKFCVERLVYDGSDPSDDWIVKSIGHSKLKKQNIKCVKINSMHEYEAGCKIHENCLGHIGISPGGMMLPIQSMCIHNVNVSNAVFKAVDIALREANAFGARKYTEIIYESMKKKTGKMRRGILNCHVDGSLRMVITPQWEFPRNVVAIPSYLKDKWVVCRIDKNTKRYITLPVKDGDYAVVVRPPSLSARSIQPMIVRYWDNTCMGISPDILKSFEGDYDGDEMHVNPVYSEAALEECIRWKNTPNPIMDKANDTYIKLNGSNTSNHFGEYILYTTMSFSQIKNRSLQPLMAEQARTKKEHTLAVADRLNNRNNIHRSFDLESIRGMSDINRRYLTQPVIGDMSRIAKIVASCVSQNDEGWIGVWSEDGFKPILQSRLDVSAGNATVRGISTICASAQQVALDAHRASCNMSPLHDMIADLVVGCDYTLVALSPKCIISDNDLESKDVKWKYTTYEAHYIICKPSWDKLYKTNDILATYNPTVLNRIQSSKRIEVCSRAIQLISTYYSIALSRHEVISLAVLFTYLPGAHALPITTRDGMYIRKLQWTETTMARHYIGLTNMVNKSDIKPCKLTTVSACLMGANFNEL